jgi:type IV/VI secretion system ImpK/VasF family protein
MDDAIANYAQPIFAYGMKLLERLEAGANDSFAQEQATLKKMLREPASSRGRDAGEPFEKQLQSASVRYALTCWLDEMFVQYSPWSEEWKKNKLEVALFGSDEGASKFWKEAAHARSQADAATLEVFFLCVQFGFQGDWRTAPDKRQAWLTAAQARLTPAAKAWQPPAALEPPTDVRPLNGLGRMKRMALVCGVSFLLVIPLLVYIVARQY